VRLAAAVDRQCSGAAQHIAAARSRAAKPLLLQVRTALSSPILFPIGDGSIPALGRGGEISFQSGMGIERGDFIPIAYCSARL
jgi:hypothetical protein